MISFHFGKYLLHFGNCMFCDCCLVYCVLYVFLSFVPNDWNFKTKMLIFPLLIKITGGEK